MATREQASEIIEKFKQVRPAILFKNIDSIQAGMQFVLIYLDETDCNTYASSLSEIMNISRARMSILLDKLIQRGFINKIVSPTDARKEVISISPLGRKEVLNKKRELEDEVIKVIDSVGFDKLIEFINIAKQIKKVVEN